MLEMMIGMVMMMMVMMMMMMMMMVMMMGVMVMVGAKNMFVTSNFCNSSLPFSLQASVCACLDL